VVILGHNGSGKSTLLRCAIRLTEPSAGSVRVGSLDVTGHRGRRLREARRRIGLVLQAPSLVPRRSVLANVATGALGRHRGASTRLGFAPRAEFGFALSCLDKVGLRELATRRADQLSGGQAQRVAIARALCQRPQVILADEPVASLDPEAAAEVMSAFRQLADEGLAVLVVLHQPELARQYADRVIGMRAGEIVFDRAEVGDIEGLYAR
jgi:phosphonate transport system ATP-binding protein